MVELKITYFLLGTLTAATLGLMYRFKNSPPKLPKKGGWIAPHKTPGNLRAYNPNKDLEKIMSGQNERYFSDDDTQEIVYDNIEATKK